ncbi:MULTISPECIES: universal stress protein [unclassified Ruegeria]|uniref:universal stress protein n=1 Tax=unclassified Ruegeria TaxID=2625375 RepID=UPI001488CA44|nr:MULTISPECIES: universal stress protein [unclassified Ruegeria]NOD75332.1 universal stress protein [Ruegeria sp. HKCCD4332]NOD87293.1 universal stress protein [Ruegeria sp. HKCCD4318]NOD91404.1 universal stress protein [Ruegeria sp. HKCCD4884]NOE12848.1 universal stress protein [Ruegeria sp. HKCCD4318-2]NOG08985.1 universal stress protein [Ruegeria sp. HKCCD4315]
MTRSVLCAIDISNGEIDVPVLQKAAALADLEGAQLDVVTVLPDFGESWVSGFFEADFHDKAFEEAQATLTSLCVKALGSERNETIRHVVATGTAYQEILKTAEGAGSDLIVIGAHKPDFKDYLLGPNASRVVRHSSVSVYVVR